MTHDDTPFEDDMDRLNAHLGRYKATRRFGKTGKDMAGYGKGVDSSGATKSMTHGYGLDDDALVARMIEGNGGVVPNPKLKL